MAGGSRKERLLGNLKHRSRAAFSQPASARPQLLFLSGSGREGRRCSSEGSRHAARAERRALWPDLGERMALKDSKKNISQEAVQKIKYKATVDNKIITVEHGEGEGFCDLQSSRKVKRKKHLKKQKDPDQKGTKKKKKKQKKDSGLMNRTCGNLPIVIESSSDSESLRDSRKIPERVKKKRNGRCSYERDGDCEVAHEGLPEEQQGANFHIRLACKRTISARNRDIVTKQKKKRGSHKLICPLMLRIRDTENESTQEISLNPKVISPDTVFSGRDKGWMSVLNSTGCIVQKKKAVFFLKSVDSSDVLEEGIANTGDQFDKGQHCKGETLRCEWEQEDEMQVSEEETNAIVKKQKKKKPEKEKVALFITSASSPKNRSCVSNENSLQSKCKKRMPIVEDKMDPIPVADGDGNVTKKNKIQTKLVSNCLPLLEDGMDERRTMKVKKSKVLQAHTTSGYDGKVEKKKKKREYRESGGFQKHTEGEPSLKKAKFKEEGKEQEDEIKVVAFKKGNGDEVNIDKDDHFGQWGTAAFEHSERKAKFLRLMGGFKKGTSVPAPDSPAHATKMNMALNNSKEEKLHQNLEAEFEKAVHWKHHRGVGLGFQPTAQKRTHIDKYMSKSIKFGD